MKKAAVAVALVGLSAVGAFAQSDVASIVSGAGTTFSAVATLCVTMGVFFIGYRIAKRVR